MKPDSVEEKILNAGFEDVIVFSDQEYDSAFIGVSEDGRAVYDYDLMIDWLIKHEGFTSTEAIEWIDFNTIRSLPYFEGAPIIVYRI